MNFFVARQPIFDRDEKLYGYELLYRGDATNNFFDGSQDDMASSKVMMDSFINYGIANITGGKRAFVNFSASLLCSEVATLFPENILTIEVLESVYPTKDVMESLRRLKQEGYVIVLDDFSFTEERQELMDLADIIKVDMLAMPIGDMIKNIKRYEHLEVKFLAEKIETQEVFDLAYALGFDLYQGFYFSKPVIVSGQYIQPIEANYLRLLKEANKMEINYRIISGIVLQDPALSYRLIKLINTVGHGFVYEIRSVHHSLVAMGEEEVRKWISLISMVGLNEGQNNELMRLSLVRARFCERIGFLTRQKPETSDKLFMMGLFSLLETMMSRPFSEIFKEVHMDLNTRRALQDHEGACFPYLALIFSYERGAWDVVEQLAKGLHLTIEQVSTAYLAGITFSEQVMDSQRMDPVV